MGCELSYLRTFPVALFRGCTGQVLDIMKKNPVAGIPVVLRVRSQRCSGVVLTGPKLLLLLTPLLEHDCRMGPMQRLKDKDEEWKRARQELSKGWKEELEKNYPKSLDHRSFYFNQADKKQISGKALLMHMKGLVEEAQRKQEPNPSLEVRA